MFQSSSEELRNRPNERKRKFKWNWRGNCRKKWMNVVLLPKLIKRKGLMARRASLTYKLVL
jgi:hypothetical protein